MHVFTRRFVCRMPDCVITVHSSACSVLGGLVLTDDDDKLWLSVLHVAGCPAQVVSERLSRHVLKNWKRFVTGINEVSTIETDLEVRSRLNTFMRAQPNLATSSASETPSPTHAVRQCMLRRPAAPDALRPERAVAAGRLHVVAAKHEKGDVGGGGPAGDPRKPAFPLV